MSDDEARERLEGCLRMTEAILDAMQDAVDSSDPSDPWRFTSYYAFMQKSNQLVEAVGAIEPIDGPINLFNLENVPTLGDTIAPQQQHYFDLTRTNLRMLKAYLENRVNPKEQRVADIADFLQANLRRAMHNRPTAEREVQETVENLLIGRGLEKGVSYDRETGRVKFSSKEFIPDFILPPLETAVEVKLLKDRSELGSLVDQINADIQAYLQGYRRVVFVIYDLGVIRDEVEFRRDIETTDGVKVIVVKH